ncbi:RDD family protein [Amycolatopsis sp., V23-08]|uniref:RDD family protein n=1 Tax=Amycolatopsis heterodermiae TaxID=3110235 RepID=A0ABU5RC45_9PSEU|nr:RDD family protein [Amycolatopsis sp., V23-08]MEA5363826.1 RDD family protein [Amycolatopsis sp., V23-08]
MTGSPPEGRIGPGVVGRRLVQFFLDEMLVFVPMLLLAVLAVVLFRPSGLVALVTFLKVVFITMMVLDFLGLWFVMTWWPYRHGGQTPAMRWLRLRVVMLDGSHPPLRLFVVRQLLVLVDGFAWGLAGIVVMLCTRRRQRFGDVVARTVVVRVPKRAKSVDEAAFPGPDGYFGAVAGPELALGRADVRLDGGQRHHE